MRCSSRPSTRVLPGSTLPGAAATDRVGDAERERSAALLADAVAGGYLPLDELDARLTRVWSARTGADLVAAEADLPETLRRQRARREDAERARALAAAALRGHVASYVGVMALLVLIWLVVGVTTQSWYPWPVWPALGWGIAVAGQLRSAGGTAALRGRAPAPPAPARGGAGSGRA